MLGLPMTAKAQANAQNTWHFGADVRLGAFDLRRPKTQNALTKGFALGLKKSGTSAQLVYDHLSFSDDFLNSHTFGVRLQQDLLQWKRLTPYVFAHAYVALSHNLTTTGTGYNFGHGLSYEINSKLDLFYEASYGKFKDQYGRSNSTNQSLIGLRFTF